MSLFRDKTAELRQNPESWSILVNEITKRMLKKRALFREKEIWIHENKLSDSHEYDGIEEREVSEHCAIIKLQNDIMIQSLGQMQY